MANKKKPTEKPVPPPAASFDPRAVQPRSISQIKDLLIGVCNVTAERLRSRVATAFGLTEEDVATLDKVGRLIEMFHAADEKSKDKGKLDKPAAEMIHDILMSLPPEQLEAAAKELRRRGAP